MCGITGFISLHGALSHSKDYLSSAPLKLKKRGPNAQGIFRDQNCELGHTRLSIIDTSSAADQPMSSENGRYTLIFNGEIYNFLSLKEELKKKYEINFKTTSDTEVLLYGLINEGKSFLQKLNGFFAFCFYDKDANYYLLARDRFGIKPLLYSFNKKHLIFGSELKAIMCYPVEKEIDKIALHQFLQFTYIPSPRTILSQTKKLEPSHLIEIKDSQVKLEKYYTYYPTNKSEDDYDTAKRKVFDLLHKSVEKRLVSDVSLGTFLSGGVDSSIISAISAKYKPNLETFSIGFPDEPIFDESKYAAKVANHISSKHHCFEITNNQLYNHLEDFLDYMDEPMADSSALNVFLLSQETKKHVTVSLSGDGADELFSGYNKHQALYFSLQQDWKNKLIKKRGDLAKILPSSRASKIGNIGRQIQKLHEGLNMDITARYLHWASFMDNKLLNILSNANYHSTELIEGSESSDPFNDFLFHDFNLVLENDMLRKVDTMSMSKSLEVRTPFLDHELVEYVFSLPSSYKIDQKNRKKILKETFYNELPKEVFSRKKHGFEIPLNKWFKNELLSFIENDIFRNNKALKMGLINEVGLKLIEKKWRDRSEGNTVYHIWSLIILDNFLKKYIF